MGYGDLDIPKSGGKYLRIEAGQPADIHILTPSEAIQTKRVYYDGKKYVELLKGESPPDGSKEEIRYAIKVLDRSDNSVKEFEFGPNIAIGIKEIAKVLEMDGETIHSVDLRISRVSEKPVRYQVVQRKKAGPVPQEAIDEASVPF